MPRLVLPSLVLFLFAQTGLGAGFVQTPPGDLPGAHSRRPCGTSGQRPPSSRIDQKKFQQSLRLLQDRLRSDSRDPGSHYQLGLLYESQSDFLKAIGEYREAVRLDRSAKEPALALASIFFHCGQNKEAVEVLEASLKTNPKSLPAIRLLCRVYLEEGKVDQALSLARKNVLLEPSDGYGHYLLGLSYKELGHFEKAKSGLEQAVELAPSFSDAYFQLGLLYRLDEKTFPQATENLKEAIEQGLTRPDVYKELGFVLLKQGRYQEAVLQLKLALKDNPDFKEPYYLLADAYRKLGMKQEAASALERFQSLRSAARKARNAAQEQQDRAQAYYQEGEDSLFQDQPGKAYSSFLKALQISPQMHSALHRLAQVDFLGGDVASAEDRIRQAIQLYSLDPEYYFLLAKCLEQRDPAAAIDAISTAIHLSPAVADFHNLLANLFFARADYHASILAYRRAIEIDADDPVPHLNLSTALRNIGAVEESERERDIYLRLTTGRNPE